MRIDRESLTPRVQFLRGVNPPYLNQLIGIIHADATARGWWSKPRTWLHTAFEVIGELAEGYEDERKGRHGIRYAFGGDTWENASRFQLHDGSLKPIGYETEIADSLIRFFDFIGHRGWKFTDEDVKMIARREDRVGTFGPLTGPERMAVMSQGLLSSPHVPNMRRFTMECLALADIHGFDLFEAIEQKLAYNRTRGFRHGDVT